MKLTVDGKKISRGKGRDMGDVDCWGFEAKPCIEERKATHKEEIVFVERLQDRIDTLELRGLRTVNTIPSSVGNVLVVDLQSIIQCLGTINKQLRAKVVSLDHMEEKFMKLSGEDWRKSKFYPVICSVRVSKNETEQQLQESLTLTNSLALYGLTPI
jgi:hypothetical protein